MMTDQPIVYKVLPRDEWRLAEDSGVFAGSGIDVEDGYIHLSSGDQVVATVEKYFAGQTDLVLVSFSSDCVDNLRWEKSRGDDLFPHAYGPISIEAVLSVVPLPLVDGKHEIPVL